MADNKIKSVKLIIVGESHVGKTSLIHQFIEGTFDEGTCGAVTGALMANGLILNDKPLNMNGK